MIDTATIQYVSDDQGSLTNVVVPIDLWREILSDLETNHLMQSDTMRQRLLEAKNRNEGRGFSARRLKELANLNPSNMT